MAGTWWVGLELVTSSIAGLAFGGCVRACVRMYKYVGWDGDRRWAEDMGRAGGGPWTGQDRTRQADKPSLGGSVGSRLADRYSTSFPTRNCKVSCGCLSRPQFVTWVREIGLGQHAWRNGVGAAALVVRP